MGGFSKYDIAYRSLREGEHEFEYQIDDRFFELFESSLAGKANVLAIVTLEKRSTLMKLAFRIKGKVELICDRCLGKYDQDIEQDTYVFIKFGEGSSEEGDDVFWVSPEEHQFNIAQLLYEYIVLSIPVKHVHPDDENGESTCNKEMLKQLEKYSSGRKVSGTDKRWEVLGKLKNSNKTRI